MREGRWGGRDNQKEGTLHHKCTECIGKGNYSKLINSYIPQNTGSSLISNYLLPGSPVPVQIRITDTTLSVIIKRILYSTLLYLGN